MAEPAPTRAATRLARGPSACQRCRRRKQKCDLKSPRCSNCEASETQCLIYNAAKGAELPRDYVTILEAQIARLRRENDELREQTSTNASPPIINQNRDDAGLTPSSSSPDWVTSSLGRIVSEPSNQSQFYGMSSGITLARLVMAAIHVEGPVAGSLDHTIQHTGVLDLPQATSTASLPPRHAALHLIDVYFQFQTPHAPIIERMLVEKALDEAYEAQHYNAIDGPGSHALFTVYMIFAIALCSINHPSGDRPPQSLECFNSAVGHIEKLFVYSKGQIERSQSVTTSVPVRRVVPSERQSLALDRHCSTFGCRPGFALGG